MDQLKVSLETLAAQVHSRMTAFEEQLKKEPAGKADTTKSLSADFLAFRTFVVASFGALQMQIEMLSADLDGMEMRSRRKMLLLHGVQESDDEDTVAAVISVAHKHLSLPELHAKDIRRAHRMGRLSTASNKPRPVLVKFVDTKTRDSAWMSKVGLKGTGITLSEFLTPRRHETLQGGPPEAWRY
ncbi:hypothetical protein NE865_11962 [Phthorimaea operculella]|nr:hypothetical protein NE865_11962 [Phthorimaea operculella]